MLSTSELHCFVTIAQSGSFARAASAMGISQPALSKTISKLERRLAVRLFERNARGVLPTMYGNALLKRATPLLIELRAASHEIETMRGGDGGVVTFGAAPAVSADFVPDLVKAMARSKPPTRLQVVEGLAEDLLEGVRRGTLAFAITTASGSLASDDLLTRPLYEDDFVVCCGIDHPLARARKVHASDLVSSSWVLAPPTGVLRKEFDQRFRKAGVPPPTALVETGSGTLSKCLVMEHGFLSLLPRELLSFEERKRYIVVLPAPWLEWRRQVSIVTRRGQIASPSVARVVAQVLKRAASRKR